MSESLDTFYQHVKNLSLEDKDRTEKMESNAEEKAIQEKTMESWQEIEQEKETDEEQEMGVEIICYGKKLLFFGIQTTGFKKDCDIVQISAIFGSQAFDQSVLPTKEISPWMSKANGLTVDDEVLYYKGNRVESADPKLAMESFVRFLKGAGEQVVMVAHNGHCFDVPRLFRNMDSVGIQLPDNVDGFLDSLLLAKELYPGRSCYPQADLVSELLGITYEAHNGIAEVKALQSLMGVMLQSIEDQKLQTVWKECFKPRSAF